MTSKNFCDKCNYRCRYTSDWEKHIKTVKHNSYKYDFKCHTCDYICSIKSHMDKHLNTQKHKTNQAKLDSYYEPEPEPEPIKEKYSELMTIITQLLMDNKELRNFIMEQANDNKKDTLEIVNRVLENSKIISNNTINGNVTNNKSFNINLYLNEKCKDAMNFTDFINNF